MESERELLLEQPPRRRDRGKAINESHPREARTVRRPVLTLGVVAAMVAALTSAAGATPTQFHLTVVGRIGQAFVATPLHEGTFSASAPFCSSGSAIDLWASATRPKVSYRMLTCDDGSGALTVRLVGTAAEHTPGRTGIWQVIEGTGSYAELRGMGTLTGVRLGDDAAQPETLRFRTEWKGLIDFDVVAPPIVVLRSSSSERPDGSYVVNVAFTAADDIDGNRVSYRVTASRSRWLLASRQGDLLTGKTSVSLRIRPLGRPRTIRLEIEAWDPVGNVRSVARSQELPR
jgi:hypothetical protein